MSGLHSFETSRKWKHQTSCSRKWKYRTSCRDNFLHVSLCYLSVVICLLRIEVRLMKQFVENNKWLEIWRSYSYIFKYIDLHMHFECLPCCACSWNISQQWECCPFKMTVNHFQWWQNDDRKFWWMLVGETNSVSHWHSVSPTRLQLGSAQIWVAPLPNQIDGGSKFKCFVILILTSIAVLSLHNPHSMSQLGNLSKTFLRIFSVKGGGTPPFPLSFFEHNDCPLRGGGLPPNSVKEKIR